MKADSSLESVLRDLTIALSEDNQMRDVKFTSDMSKFGYATPDNTVHINPNHAKMLDVDGEITKEQEFALLVGTHSHELEHQVVTEMNIVKDFVEQYKERPRLASMVINIIEDTYIDKRRTDRDRGLRPTMALFCDLWMDKQKPIHEVNGVAKYMQAVAQIARGGTPKDYHNEEDEEFRNFCAKVRILIEDSKESYVQGEREELAHDIMGLIEDHIGSVEAPKEVNLPKSFEPVDGEELPEPNESNIEENIEEQESEQESEQEAETIELDFGEDGQEDGEQGEDGQEQGEQNNSQSGNSTERNLEPNCPVCGYEHPNEDTQVVDGMTAARVTPPFDTDEDWVGNSEFIQHEDENGLCGFRVLPNDNVPKARIENQGYKIDEVHSHIEILEPKQRYDEKETVQSFKCPECDHEWIPNE